MSLNILRLLQRHSCSIGLHKWNKGLCDSCGVIRTTGSLQKLKQIALDFRDPDAFLTAVRNLAGYTCIRSDAWGHFIMKKGNHTLTINVGRDMLARHDMIYNMVYENKAKSIRFVLIENGEFQYA
ncbi:MAG: hypothetical protein JW973_03840 [Bacteroidales bacterium]|nr:hypothetical protein [Bacteroidales bacterium]